MEQFRTLILVLMALSLAACNRNGGRQLTGFYSTPDVAWQEADLADSTQILDTEDFKVNTKRSIHGHFQFQQAQRSQSITGACVLLDIENANYDSVSGDYDMRYLSVASDEQLYIPYLYSITREMPEVKVYLYLSSIPEWIQASAADEQLFSSACLLYTTKIIKGYSRRGIGIEAVALADSCPCDDSHANEAFMAELKRLGYNSVQASSLATSTANDKSAQATWNMIRDNLDDGRQNIVMPVLVGRDDSLSLAWKKCLLKHLQPLRKHDAEYMRGSDADVMAFSLGRSALLLAMNPAAETGAVDISDSRGEEATLWMPARSVCSVTLNDEDI